MSKHEQRQGVRAYHVIVAILILLGGGALLGLGIWLMESNSGNAFNLDFADSGFLKAVLSIDLGAIIIGIFLLLTGLVSIFAMARNCFGVTFRIIYIVMATIVLAVLLLVTVFSALIVSRRGGSDLESFLEDAWARTVDNEPSKICKIENHFKCRGFNDGDCANCRDPSDPGCGATENCASCDHDALILNSGNGCLNEIKYEWRDVFLPVAIVGSILSLIVLLDMLMTSCL